MKKLFKKIRFMAAFIFIFIAFMLFFYLAFLNYYNNKFFPGVKIVGQDVGGQNVSTVAENFNAEYSRRVEKPLNLTYQNQNITLNLKSSLPETNLGEVVKTAYLKGRSGNIFSNIGEQLKLALVGQDFSPEVKFNNYSQIISEANLINQKIHKEPIPAQIVFAETLNITPSQNGIELDRKAFTTSLEEYLNFKKDPPLTLSTKSVSPNLTSAKAEKYKQILERVKNSPIRLYYNNDAWVIDQATLYSLLDFDRTKKEVASYKNGGQDFTLEEITIGKSILTDNELLLDSDKLSIFLENIAKKIDQPLKEAKFIFDEQSQRVTEFQPGQQGKELNIKKASSLISEAVGNKNILDLELPVEITYPKNSVDEINNLGIKELLGTGTSSFIDSIPNRVFNIGLASLRTNGILIPPGETFSFNQYIGEISAATGYKQAYVIKEGKTILDDGGGVCQVSTTLFRAVLNAGLPITARTAHAYRVGFYEQGGTPPGFDATVYPPSVDFKFKNDTKNHILIQNQMVGTTLYFKIYGTSDGRVVTIGKPVVLSQTPPPPDLRQDDPTLPKGTEKEIEHSIWGMNTQFKRIVTRNGETIIDEVWRSNFRPWQKITLVGTKE